MSLLLESPIAVGAIGLFVTTCVALVYFSNRSKGAFVATVVALLLTMGAVTFERWWQTPREQVRSAVVELFDAIRANDLPGVLALIDTKAIEMRADAEALMPMFTVQSAGPGQVKIEVISETIATVRHKPLIKVQHKKSGAMGAYFDTLRVDFVLRDGRWLASDYEPAEDWRSEAGRL